MIKLDPYSELTLKLFNLQLSGLIESLDELKDAVSAMNDAFDATRQALDDKSLLDFGIKERMKFCMPHLNIHELNTKGAIWLVVDEDFCYKSRFISAEDMNSWSDAGRLYSGVAKLFKEPLSIGDMVVAFSGQLTVNELRNVYDYFKKKEYDAIGDSDGED